MIILRFKFGYFLLCMLLSLLWFTACGVFDSSDDQEVALRPIFPTVGEYFSAVWGPDDRLAVIYMQLREDGKTHKLETHGLYTIDLDGTDLHQVVLNRQIGAQITGPVWSPNGQWIAFSAGGEIFKVRPDGMALIRLTYGGEAKFEPSWSPDGQWIAFRIIYGPDEGRGLWKVSADGKTIKQLRRPPIEEMCLDCDSLDRWTVRGGPSWSKNANEIAYIAFENRIGDRHLAVYDTTRARVEFLYKSPVTLSRARFSPDGGRILFFMYSSWGSYDLSIGVINRDGSGFRRLKEHAVEPSWSPCGNRIVYRLFSYRDGLFGQPGYGDLWIMNADGSNNRQITFSTGVK